MIVLMTIRYVQKETISNAAEDIEENHISALETCGILMCN